MTLPSLNPQDYSQGCRPQSVVSVRPASASMFTRHCLAYGVPFSLRAAQADGLLAMLDLLPFGTTMMAERAPGDACFNLPPVAHPQFANLLARLEHQILLHVAVHASDRTFLHAGVVAWRGRAILLPGSSHAGKSTLVAELIKLGAVYYSDEYAVLDSSGIVHPYSRDLRLRVPGCTHQIYISPESLSGRVADSPAVVAHVVLTNFVPGTKWNPQPLTQGTAVLAMLPHCVAARRTPARILSTLKAVMGTAQACRTARGDAKATARVMLQTFGPAGSPA